MAKIITCQVQVLDGSNINIDVNVSSSDAREGGPAANSRERWRHTLRWGFIRGLRRRTEFGSLHCLCSTNFTPTSVAIYLCRHFSKPYSLFLHLQTKATGEILLEEVYKHLGLEETDYFGLQFIDKKQNVVSVFLHGQRNKGERERISLYSYSLPNLVSS